MRLQESAVAEARPDVAVQRAHMIATYSAYAEGYDQAAEVDGFLSPGRIARALAATLPDRGTRILDVACGTGLVGLHLHRMGYRDITGADITFAMLSRARAKGCYGLVVQADLNAPLPFAAQSFDVISCAGAFYDDNVRANVLDHLLPLLKPQGYLFCDIELHAWEHYGFQDIFAHPDREKPFAELVIEPANFFRAEEEGELHGYYVTLRLG